VRLGVGDGPNTLEIGGAWSGGSGRGGFDRGGHTGCVGRLLDDCRVGTTRDRDVFAFKDKGEGDPRRAPVRARSCRRGEPDRWLMEDGHRIDDVAFDGALQVA